MHAPAVAKSLPLTVASPTAGDPGSPDPAGLPAAAVCVLPESLFACRLRIGYG